MERRSRVPGRGLDRRNTRTVMMRPGGVFGGALLPHRLAQPAGMRKTTADDIGAGRLFAVGWKRPLFGRALTLPRLPTAPETSFGSAMSDDVSTSVTASSCPGFRARPAIITDDIADRLHPEGGARRAHSPAHAGIAEA